MAMTTQQRSAKAAEKRRAKEVEILRLPAPPGTKAQLADLMVWHDLEVAAEAMSLAIMNLHALGPAGSAHAFIVPRHEITISETVARALHDSYRREQERETEE
ncbi:hypothetical protein [Pseudomonas sp. GV071]|uniref:hypothetical protein n=1 Tax=Pseudomonas sp. GV071 TaxID=2135754 RepID=UPI000D37A821|nr:hypothetical protein [Pseudomonas sp. GV071]PTQ70385.1 hypothetical protein C8K61_106107 [Pseudomonas sp. GV071]